VSVAPSAQEFSFQPKSDWHFDSFSDNAVSVIFVALTRYGDHEPHMAKKVLSVA